MVEDDLTLRDTLTYNLERQGYEVFAVGDGRQALALAREHMPDLLILDLMLPGIDGLEVCRILRRETTVPILMLTARSREIDKVSGLEVGADDYVTKPFSMRELLARVKAQLRRAEFAQETRTPLGEDQPLVFDDLVIDPSRCEVRLRGEVVHLKPKEYELLLFFAQNKNIALSRDLILERVWGWDFDGESRTVDVHVRWLREKIEDDPAQPTRIVTVRGVGYRFEG